MAALLDPDGRPQRTGAEVRSESETYLAQIERDSAGTPRLHVFSAAIAKVSHSDAPGLFDIYAVPGRGPTTTAKVSSAPSTAAAIRAPPAKKGLTRRILPGRRRACERLPQPSTLRRHRRSVGARRHARPAPRTTVLSGSTAALLH